jgi:hypothetical protein
MRAHHIPRERKNPLTLLCPPRLQLGLEEIIRQAARMGQEMA